MTGRTIFIGNIPYGVTDDTIKEIFGRSGTILTYRALIDKETGKPRGYAFAEFSDADDAATAVRNLNDFEIQGRKLRVDWANDKSAEKDDQPQHSASDFAAASAPSTALPPLPQGRDLAPNMTAEDTISKTLSTLPAPQLLEILQHMQSLVMNEPSKAQALLEQSPQLSYAIFQSLLLLNLVDTNTLTQIITATAAATPQPPPEVQQQTYQAPPPQPPAPYQQPPQQQQYANPYQQQGYQQTLTPVPQQYAAPPQQPPQGVDPQKAALIQQVLAMTEDQINALQPPERDQILALRAHLRSGMPI